MENKRSEEPGNSARRKNDELEEQAGEFTVIEPNLTVLKAPIRTSAIEFKPKISSR